MSTLALCIPAYNASATLPRLLISAAKQQIPFDEIWVYDDCSTDDTAAVAAQYGAQVVQGDVNRGCSYGKNTLTGFTNCQWIHFHDADDDLLPNFTTLAHHWMNKTDHPDVVLFDYEYRDNDTNRLLAVKKFNAQMLADDAIAYAISEQINPFCGLYKKEVLVNAGGYDIDPLILYNEDKAFHIKLALYGLRFSAENEISIINYRMTGSMSAANQQKCAVAQYYVLKQTATACGKTYAYQLSRQLWISITFLASYQQWGLVKEALSITKELGYRTTSDKNKVLTWLSHIDPFLAIWIRENLIRLFKPHLRK